MTTTIEIHQGELADFRADVIVNATNRSLLGGGAASDATGDGTIVAKAGPGVITELQRIRESNLTDGLEPGEAVATNAGNLPAKWLVHTVGPEWDAQEDRSETLASSYIESLELADKLGADTIALPLVDAGGSWPVADVARIAIEAIRGTDTHLSLATFVVGETAAAALEAALAANTETAD